MVLKVLYDEDLVSEEDMLEFYKRDDDDVDEEENPGFKSAKDFAAPFLSWLEEDSDDSDSDSD